MLSKTRASIDIGSNSILLLAGTFNEDGSFVELLNESEVTGLGRGLDQTLSFSEIAMQESLEALTRYALLVTQIGLKPEEVIVTATEAARVAKNSIAFFEKVKLKTNLEVQIISGEGEAYFSSKGILFNSQFFEDQISIMDIGGASTEVIVIEPSTGDILSDFSMPFGAVRMTNWLEENCDQFKLDNIFSNFREKFNNAKNEKLYCVAGTMTSVANMYLGHQDFQEKKIHGLSIQAADIFKMQDLYNDFTPSMFLEKFPFLGKRSNTIKGGMLVAVSVLKWLDVKEVIISTYGLRYGTLEKGYIPDEYLVR